MSGPMNSVLAQQVQALLDTQKQFGDRLTAWLGGSADGGPNLDGRYPFVDVSGREILVPAPATFNDMVSGPVAMADVAKVAAELARDLAQGHADRADAQRVLADAARGAAIDARNLAQEHRSHAGTHEANARYWAEQAQGAGEGTVEDRAVVEQLAGETADNAAQASQDAQDAAASAALAATFEPALYDLKSDLLSADRITGVLSVDRIPVLPSQRQFMSSGDLTALTSTQQSAIGRGSVVTTTDGMRYVYSGEGSKTVAASYTILADITPEWNVISNRPSQFPPTAHTHPWADVTGKPTTFPATAHGHSWSDISDRPTSYPATAHTHLWADLTDKPDTYPATAHAHPWDQVTGKPVAYPATAHSHLWSEITGKPTTLSGYGITNGQAALGFTPVQQGTGTGQASNVVKIGWKSGSRLGLTVDSTDLGNFVMDSHLTWANVSGKPATFNPSAHGHAVADISGLQTALDAKAPLNNWTNVSGSGIVTGQKQFRNFSSSALANGTTGGGASLEVLGNGGAAFMSFHRPGAYAAFLGLDTDNQWKVGGWSAGEVSQPIWTGFNFDPNGKMNRGVDAWHTSSEGRNRFYFQSNGRTYYGAGNGHEFRGSADQFLGILDNGGHLTVEGSIRTDGNNLFIRGGSPTLTFRDNDHRSAMVHVNSNTFYVLRGAGTDSEAWATVHGRWPLAINLETNDATFGGNVNARTDVYHYDGHRIPKITKSQVAPNFGANEGDVHIVW